MDTKDKYDLGEKKFNSYLDLFEGKNHLSKRIDKLFNYFSDNDPEILAFLFRQATPLVESIFIKEKHLSDKIQSMIKTFLILIDSLIYAEYINDNFYPNKLRLKQSDNRPSVIFEIPKDLYNEMKEYREYKLKKINSKNKKNGKK